MKSKYLIVLGIIFLALLGAFLMKRALLKPELATQEYTTVAISLNPEDVYAIEVKSASDKEPFRLEKESGLWRIPSKWGIKAKQDKVESLFGMFTDMEGELRSSSEKLFPDYGISDSQALSIVMHGKDNKKIQSVFVGQEKPSYGSSFVRLGDSADVYAVDKNIPALFGIYSSSDKSAINIDNWMDLTIFDINPDEVDSFAIVRTGESGEEIITAKLYKEAVEGKSLKRWQSAEKTAIFNIDAQKIKNFLKSINSLRAVKALSPDGRDYGFDTPYAKCIFVVNGKTEEALIGNRQKKDSGDRYIRNPQGRVYLARRYVIDKLDVDTSRFFIDNPLRLDEDSVSSITVKSGDETVELNKELIDKNTDYLDKLKKFSPAEILFDEKYSDSVKEPSEYLLEITNEDGEKLTLYAEEEDDNTYIARLKGNPAVFRIKKYPFDQIFSNLSKINLAPEPPADTE